MRRGWRQKATKLHCKWGTVKRIIEESLHMTIFKASFMSMKVRLQQSTVWSQREIMSLRKELEKGSLEGGCLNVGATSARNFWTCGTCFFFISYWRSVTITAILLLCFVAWESLSIDFSATGHLLLKIWRKEVCVISPDLFQTGDSLFKGASLWFSIWGQLDWTLAFPQILRKKGLLAV